MGGVNPYARDDANSKKGVCFDRIPVKRGQSVSGVEFALAGGVSALCRPNVTRIEGGR